MAAVGHDDDDDDGGGDDDDSEGSAWHLVVVARPGSLLSSALLPTGLILASAPSII